MAYLGRLISLDDLGQAGRQRLRALVGRIDRGILDAADAAVAAVTDTAGDLIDRVDGTAGRIADGAGEVVERGGEVLDDARDAIRGRVKKPF